MNSFHVALVGVRAGLNDVAPDGSIILNLLRGSGDIYALEVELP